MPILTVTDPQGYEIALEQERWQHVIEGHPELRGHQELLRQALAQPEIIVSRCGALQYALLLQTDRVHHSSESGHRRAILRSQDIYVSAVVWRPQRGKQGRVITAYFVRQPRKSGEIIWLSRRTN